MKFRTNTLPICWWCLTRPADTREHRWPRSLFERLYGEGAYVKNGGGQPIHRTGEIQHLVRGAGADVLTYRSSLCSKCNNERSQPFDLALQKFFHYAIDNQEDLARDQCIDFLDVYGQSWPAAIDYLIRAFAKDLGCRLAESGTSIPKEIMALLDCGWEAQPCITTHLDLNLGVLANFSDIHSFIGKTALEAILSKDGALRAVSYFYNVSYLRCFVGYGCRDRIVNVDRLHPRKRRVFISWGMALSEDRLRAIRKSDASLGYDDVVDVTGNRSVDLPVDEASFLGPAR